MTLPEGNKNLILGLKNGTEGSDRWRGGIGYGTREVRGTSISDRKLMYSCSSK